MKIFLKSDNFFLDQLKDEEIIVFRKRMTSMILATDMAHHMSGLNIIKDKIKRLGISKELQNGHLFLEDCPD